MLIRRKIEKDIDRQLGKDNLLLLIGARQVGKTTLLNQIRSRLEAEKRPVDQLTFEDPQFLGDLNEHPENLFKYIRKPQNDQRRHVLLDEIQYLDDPSNFLKYTYDLYHDSLKIVGTGSSAFYIDKKFKDSLAGRKRILRVLPFSFSEFLRAHGEERLADEIETGNVFKTGGKRRLLVPDRRKIERLWAEYSTFGGYPRVVLETEFEEKRALLKELHQSILKKDVLESGIRDEKKFHMLLRIIASQCGELVNVNELSNTIGLSHTAVENHIYVLEKSFIIQLCSPFHRNLRKELTKMPKVFMFDPGYRNSLLNNFSPVEQRLDQGASLENLFFSELVKSGVDDLNFWRTQDKKEVDFIVEQNRAFEIKSQIIKFKTSKYKTFTESYPDIPLSPVALSDETELDVLDFAS